MAHIFSKEFCDFSPIIDWSLQEGVLQTAINHPQWLTWKKGWGKKTSTDANIIKATAHFINAPRWPWIELMEHMEQSPQKTTARRHLRQSAMTAVWDRHWHRWPYAVACNPWSVLAQGPWNEYEWMVAKIVEFFLHGIHWIGLMENLPAFLPSNIGVSCKFSHHPILWGI